MTTFLRNNFIAMLAGILLLSASFSAFIAPNEDPTMLTWGELKVASDKITMVKTADFIKNMPNTMTFTVGKKTVNEVNGTIALFPIDAETPPAQIDLTNGTISETDQKVLLQYAKWGTKVFIENATCTLKGKVKPILGVGIKLN